MNYFVFAKIPINTKILINIDKQWEYYWGISSAGRALRWQRRGQEFDPPILHQ